MHLSTKKIINEPAVSSSMIDFNKLRQKLNSYDSEREKLIKKSRDVLKLSKLVIYAVHRDEDKNALFLLKEMESEKRALDKIARHSQKMTCEGSYKLAVQEYVEAVLYYHFVKTGKLINLSVSPEHFVLGLADLPGEMVRKAVYLAGKGKIEQVVKIRNQVDYIYGELLKFDFRDNEIRRKVDGIKYDLRKLEDLVLELGMRRK